jgi:hypothetical protein
MDIQLTVDDHTVLANIDRIIATVPEAVSRAMNKSIASGRTIMAREISRDLGVKVGEVRDQLKVTSAHPKRLVTILEASGKRIPLIEFNASGPEPTRGKGRGVSYRIQGRRKRIAGAFLATLKSGHRGVFIKASTLARESAKAWSKNLPIVELFGPSLPKVFLKFRPMGLARSMEQLRKNLISEFRFVMSKAA